MDLDEFKTGMRGFPGSRDERYPRVTFSFYYNPGNYERTAEWLLGFLKPFQGSSLEALFAITGSRTMRTVMCTPYNSTVVVCTPRKEIKELPRQLRLYGIEDIPFFGGDKPHSCRILIAIGDGAVLDPKERSRPDVSGGPPGPLVLDAACLEVVEWLKIALSNAIDDFNARELTPGS